MITNFVFNKAKGRISKRVFQKNKARQILFFGKFGVLCFFFETPVLRSALLPYYQRLKKFNQTVNFDLFEGIFDQTNYLILVKIHKISIR